MKTETLIESNGGQAHLADKIISKEFEITFQVRWPEPKVPKVPTQDQMPWMKDEKMDGRLPPTPPECQIPAASDSEKEKIHPTTPADGCAPSDMGFANESSQKRNGEVQHQNEVVEASSSTCPDTEKKENQVEEKGGDENDDTQKNQEAKSQQFEFRLEKEVDRERERKQQEERNVQRSLVRLKKDFGGFLAYTADKIERRNVYEANRRLNEKWEQDPKGKFPPECFVKALAKFFRVQNKEFYGQAKAVAKRIPLFGDEKVIRRARKLLDRYVQFHEGKYRKPFNLLILYANRRAHKKQDQISK